MQFLEEALKAIGLVVVAGGGLTAMVYAIFKRFGEKWLDAKFEERLAAYKHEQQKELEQVRFKINTLFDRATKLHQREFDVLPEAWSRLNDAYWKTLSFVSPLQQYPDLDRMSNEHFREYVTTCPLSLWEKEEILSEANRNEYFSKHIFWHHLADAKGVARESHVYLLKNGVFLPQYVREKFSALDTLIWEALDEREFNEQHEQRPRDLEKCAAFRRSGPDLLKKLELDVQGRLWDSQTNTL